MAGAWYMAMPIVGGNEPLNIILRVCLDNET